MAVRPYLQLVRLPAVFTAMADIFLGFLLVRGGFDQAPVVFGLLLAASSCLYMAGMVFNDVFDRETDARERPGRPIPSGRVPLRAAVGLGLLLVAVGLGAAAAAGFSSLLIAAGLVLGVFAYDGLLKRTPIGPLVMGGCRFLNVMLGASAAAEPWDTRDPPQVYIAAALGTYIVGVTWFARQEATRSERRSLVGAMGIVNLGLAGLVALVIGTGGGLGGRVEPMSALFPLAVIILVINRRLAAALADPSPERVQASVRTLLLSLVMLDAVLVFVATGEPVYAIATAALLVPAIVLGRWVFIT